MWKGEDRSSIYFGNCLAGVPVRLHGTYFLLLAIQVISALTKCSTHPSNAAYEYVWFVFFLYGPVLLITVVIHEFGHALMTQYFGGKCDGIVLWPLGGFALCGPTSGGVIEDFFVAFAGPVTHIPQALLWWALLAWIGYDHLLLRPEGQDDPAAASTPLLMMMQLETIQSIPGFLACMSAQAINLNISLFVCNLMVPAYPLDGGRCLASLLVYCGLSVKRASYATAVTAMSLAAPIIVLGAFEGWNAARNSGGGGGGAVFLMFVGLFVFYINADLFVMTWCGEVYEHPLFTRQCYQPPGKDQQHQGDQPEQSQQSDDLECKLNDEEIDYGYEDDSNFKHAPFRRRCLCFYLPSCVGCGKITPKARSSVIVRTNSNNSGGSRQSTETYYEPGIDSNNGDYVL